MVHRREPEKIAAMIVDLYAKCGAGSEQALLTTQCLYYNLLNTMFRLAQESDVDVKLAIGDRDLTLTGSLESMKENIQGLYTYLCERIPGHRQETAAVRKKDDIIGYIEANCTDDSLTLQTLSEHFGMSVSYLSKIVKQQTGQNFVDFVGEKRIDMAKRLLVETDDTVENIGQKVGYYNALSFRRAFKKYAGVTPGTYRSTVKGNEHE